MRFERFLIFVVVVCFFWMPVFSQKRGTTDSSKAILTSDGSANKSTPAYAEILLAKAELEAEIDELAVSYKDEHPKLKTAHFEFELLKRDLAMLLTQTEPAKLTLALAKLILRRDQIETDLWVLEKQYGADHPDVIKCRKKLAIFQNAVKEILY